MLLFKKIDLIIQAILLVVTTVGIPLDIEVSFVTLMALGGVQLISTAVHLALPSHFRDQKLRKVYYILLGVALVGFYLLVIVVAAGIGGLIFYTIGTFLMAIYYVVICVLEHRRISNIIPVPDGQV